MDNAAIEKFKSLAKCKNTTSATAKWLNCYKSWAQLNNYPENIEDKNTVDLDAILQNFFANVKKQNGEEYEPCSLAGLQAGIERHLKESGYPTSIISGREFKDSRAVLEGRARYLRELGYGKKPQKAESLSSHEEEMLWQCGQLGMHCGKSLINTLWLLFTQHFGLRGRQEHHDMKVEDYTFKIDDEGNNFLTFAEGITKTRQSGLREKSRLTIPKMFENPSEPSRCPLAIFQFYLSKRPLEYRQSGPFYLAIISNPTTDIWFKKSPIGVNTINNIMKSMKTNSPLSNSKKRLTNHSARKTVVKKLKKAHVPRSEIIGITGHRSEGGLDPYDSGDEVEQRAISLAIDGVSNAPASSLTASASNTPINNNALSHPFIIAQNNSKPPPCFKFFSDNVWSTFEVSPRSNASSIPLNPIFNFHNCSVTIGTGQVPSSSSPISASKPKRKHVFICDSSDEE